MFSENPAVHHVYLAIAKATETKKSSDTSVAFEQLRAARALGYITDFFLAKCIALLQSSEETDAAKSASVEAVIRVAA